ncbi:MAG: bifunctional folylpolyglutamate synthase/ dihydrofolate synthase, partial [Kangiellaceae bacterium]|nr:bifunctional folylpolyglutamate synthase/ dihydrofolate synthase [Kangiellaceae bacterium]
MTDSVALSFNQWLDKIEQMHPADIEMGLERIKAIAERLELLTPSCKVITVGGTNGKGSTVAMLESLCIQANRKVGVYTSPHLVRFNERIKV